MPTRERSERSEGSPPAPPLLSHLSYPCTTEGRPAVKHAVACYAENDAAKLLEITTSHRQLVESSGRDVMVAVCSNLNFTGKPK